MAGSTDAPVVVGVGPTPADLPVVRLAAREAAAHGRPLHLLHAFNWEAAFAGPTVAGTRDAGRGTGRPRRHGRERGRTGADRSAVRSSRGHRSGPWSAAPGRRSWWPSGTAGWPAAASCVPGRRARRAARRPRRLPGAGGPPRTATAGAGAGRRGRLTQLPGRAVIGPSSCAARRRRPAHRGAGGRAGGPDDRDERARRAGRPGPPAPSGRAGGVPHRTRRSRRPSWWSSPGRRRWRWSAPAATSRGGGCWAR